MPYFVMYRFPSDYVGGRLCWRGDVLWQGADGHFQALSHQGTDCRDITVADVGRQIYGVGTALRVAAALAVLILLVRVRWRTVAPVLALTALAVAVVAIDDTSFLGGWRPMDGGDDGLFYTGVGR